MTLVWVTSVRKLCGWCSVTQWCPALCDPMDWSTPSFPVLYYLQEFAQIHVHWAGDAIQPSHPLLPPSLPAFNLSQYQGFFQWGSSHQLTKVLELQLQHHPFSECSGLISIRIDWFDHLTVQGTVKSLLQHHNSKASILKCSSFIVQISHPYMTKWEKP